MTPIRRRDDEKKNEGDIKLGFKRAQSDALVLKEHKLDEANNLKTAKRLGGTWRLKQKNVDTSKLMQEYKRKAQVQTVDPSEMGELDAMDRIRRKTYYLVSNEDVSGYIAHQDYERE